MFFRPSVRVAAFVAGSLSSALAIAQPSTPAVPLANNNGVAPGAASLPPAPDEPAQGDLATPELGPELVTPDIVRSVTQSSSAGTSLERDQAQAEKHIIPAVPLPSIPFDHVSPYLGWRLSSRTQIDLTWVNSGLSTDPARSASLWQAASYEHRWRPVALEVMVGGIAATAINSTALASSGAGGEGRGDLGFALVGDYGDWTIALRGNAGLNLGYRVNVQPLVYRFSTNPISVLDGNNQIGDMLGYPVWEYRAGPSFVAVRKGSFGTLQLATRYDYIDYRESPWLEPIDGTTKSGQQKLVYHGDRFSLGAHFVSQHSGEFDWQAQLSFAWRKDTLNSPRQYTFPNPPNVKYWLLAPAVGGDWHVNSDTSIGLLAGVQFGSAESIDPYLNTASTTSYTVFVQFPLHLWR